ncbi:LysM peptidoglycan-binding domain-containing protein [Cryomorpha ignava]|uniref:LysM peptidoglycan-binding domain-containing protein n=1 Tax=Cryomorpha ignava TaxID=101383 RepID=A0A7K3WRY7_9FLAO|nr:LysM peptidoglycan-binding domain-containing protein [Cryomorpha ignava]NEN24433.1 LysM peptidoglycan-binding domain-containing protein [Cryomorpha ignava]
MGIKKQFVLIFGIVALLSSACATAQNYPERTRDGEDFFVYTVEPGNTLFAISRLFSVKTEDLLKANPDAKSGLSIGQEIFIPKDKIDKKSARKTEVNISGEYILHTVQRKETLFSISGKYGADVNEVMELNPDAALSLGVGDVIRIPAVTSTKTKEIFLEPARNDTFMVHQVLKGETAYSLAKEFEISVDSLSKANNNFESGMNVGQWIVIPKFKASYLAEIEEESPVDSVSIAYPSGFKKKYKIGLMLPFELAHNDSLDRALMDGKDLYILTEISLDYYRGAKIALDSLKRMGLNADVYIYDAGEDLVQLKDVLRKPEINDLDIIFGPMHKTSIALVSDASKKNETYLVSPNSFSNEVFEDNPFLVRAMASRETMMRYLANYVAIQHQDDNVIMINSESANDWPFRKIFKENYNKAIGSFSNVFSDSLRSVGISLTKPENVDKWLRKDQKNILVVPSNELAFVSDFMTRLSRIDPSYEIQIYGLDNWMRYDNIDAEYKNRFRLRLVVPNFVDYQKEVTKHFLRKYREEFNMEPTQYGYGYMGYDLTLFFGESLIKYGLSIPEAFKQMEMKGVNSDYRFGRSTTGMEFENKSVYIIEYNDYQIKQVN